MGNDNNNDQPTFPNFPMPQGGPSSQPGTFGFPEPNMLGNQRPAANGFLFPQPNVPLMPNETINSRPSFPTPMPNSQVVPQFPMMPSHQPSCNNLIYPGPSFPQPMGNFVGPPTQQQSFFSVPQNGGIQEPLAETGPGGEFMGPMLRFSNLDLSRQLYHATVLIVSMDEECSLRPPALYLYDSGREQQIAPVKLDEFQEHSFWRYSLTVPVTLHQKQVEYALGQGGEKYTFYVQGIEETWRWSFFSCNGFSNDVDAKRQEEAGGADPLWNDMMEQHAKAPFHAMVGGGDQLYCDDVFLEPSMKAWLDIPSRKERDAVVFTPPMEEEVMEFYFKTYCSWFSQGTFATALATIPYAMVSDDHDIFDGFGSYPVRMMNSPVFQGIFKCALRCFLLFQGHTTAERGHREGHFGEKSYSWLKMFGPYTAVLGVDNRSERSIKQLLTSGSYEIMFQKLYQEIPPSCTHLMVILGIPIVYPRLSEIEDAMNGLSVVQHKLNIHKLFHKTGAFSQLVNQFGQPELLDDLCDHWTASDHLQERHEFVLKLQGFARDRSIRVSFLAGDVHLGAAGYFRSADANIPMVKDHRHMTQIVSSGIVNLPPPDMVVTMLHRSCILYQLDNYTHEEMYELFKNDVDGKDLGTSNKCLNRRNWCGVFQSKGAHEVRFVLFVEKKDSPTVPYEVLVQPLLLGNQGS
ncbi:hypothetical protein DSO57_1025474 [Entomophthora muscae]|uniref:Uncharacterized protein n=1 Tax=Entomophthora muscae TaxID=34485 RepID=A0ACC2RGY0_9FUNG|nr:hypothetical protein DSO57_1025474 [Entomophthora muscae]